MGMVLRAADLKSLREPQVESSCDFRFRRLGCGALTSSSKQWVHMHLNSGFAGTAEWRFFVVQTLPLGSFSDQRNCHTANPRL